MARIVELENVRKVYGSLTAVDGLSFSIEEGDVFGLLGPNGAGKTTTVEMIEGLRKPNAGSIRVAGKDVRKGIAAIREILGVQLQTTSLPELLRVSEILTLFASYYKNPLPVHEVLEEVSLTDKSKSYIQNLSGGQHQRLALALALINDPKILILDEPTTGLDPQARHNLWDIITRMSERGKTIILTTHYMEEAEKLCNKVGIMDHSRIIALDSPDNLIAQQDFSTAITVKLSGEFLTDEFKKMQGVTKVKQIEDQVTLWTAEATNTLIKLARKLDKGELTADTISMRRATLEDVFLNLTGHSLRD